MREPDSDAADKPGDRFERIAPVSLNAAPAASSRPGNVVEGATVSTRTLLIGIVAILLLAAALLFGLPALRVAGPPPAAAPAVAATPAAVDVAKPAASTTPAADVWDDEALLRARQEAQELAAQIGKQIEDLRAKAVERWATAAFAEAQAQVAKAAAAFEAKDFRAAVEGYRAVSASLKTLEADSGRQLEAARAAGVAAFAAGDLDTATAAFELALAIAPGDPVAMRGKARIASFPAVQQQLQLAGSAEARGDSAAAANAWRAALKLDPDTESARAALARIEGSAAAARFGKTMAAALAALDAGRLDDAERELQAAAAQRPGDPAIADARARIARVRREQQLTNLSTQAEADSAAEQWSSAVQRYEAVLAIDPSLAAAQAGLKNARPRATLAARLDGYIAQPARLGSDAVHAEAAQVLATAKAVATPGPLLQKQIASLDRLLAAAVTLQEIDLQSDDKTEVTVYKVGPQGKFKNKRLQLKPGRYTAVGARPGYIDVRVEFEVLAGSPTAPVAIRCEEKL